MRVITRKALVEYWEKHPGTKPALMEWHVKTSVAKWNTPVDIKRTFPQVDSVVVGSRKTVYVFNIGRAHRLIAAVHFDYPRVFVLRLLSHKEYDLNRWKGEL